MKSLLLFLLLLPSLVMAVAADPQTYLTKLSKSIKGIPPTLAERQALEKLSSASDIDTYMKGRISEYLQSPSFELKFKDKIDELFRFTAEKSTESQYFAGHSSYDYLVQDLIHNNQSWDQLLLNKKYKVNSNDSVRYRYSLTELDFYHMLTNQVPAIPDAATTLSEQIHRYDHGSVSDTLLNFNFDDSDLRMAGVLTTPRFLTRYVDTALNKNRRRASAVFRVFLCDSMVPAIPAKTEDSEKTDFNVLFPGNNQSHGAGMDPGAMGNADLHGAQADCRACHYKLDPMGQTFALSAGAMSPFPSPGALTFKSMISLKDINMPVAGVGELAKNITQQDDYVHCQVKHFWDWYVGTDAPMNQKMENDLAQKFNEVGRRPKDFISYLVSLDIFKERPQILSEAQILARRVVPIFKNCNSCHQLPTKDDMNGMDTWDLTEMPYGNTPEDKTKAIRKISKALGVGAGNLKQKMPPPDSTYKLSDDDYLLLKRWIEKGAPDFTGMPQVTQ